MPFPYERYETLDVPVKLYYPAGQQTLARQVWQHIEKASALLAQLLSLPTPAMEMLIAAPADWDEVPHEEETDNPLIMLPFLTHSTQPPTLVIPTQLDPIVGNDSVKKRAFLMFHELAHLVLENDPRPWSLDHPLWADEWQMQFAALWLAQQIFHINGIVQTDLHKQYAEIFVPEADGKTPVTVRGFDWYEDTPLQDYLEYTLLLERFAADLLARYDAAILPRFLVFFREEQTLLSDDVTDILAAVLGDGGKEWLENLDYF
jgi:hypothetical protein